MSGAAAGLGAAAAGKGVDDVQQQLLECRAALAAQHAACEELRQQNQQLVAALQQTGCSV
jgi:F0F1-type ATP synthase membrane subunit b/b'